MGGFFSVAVVGPRLEPVLYFIYLFDSRENIMGIT